MPAAFRYNTIDSELHFVINRTMLRAVGGDLAGRYTLGGLGQRCGEQ